jgi:putative ATPase
VRKVIEASRDRRAHTGKRTILFIDEIHRFSKAQQDALLHAAEDGVITLIGASTENPYFEVIPALISRCELYQFEPLSKADIGQLLEKALEAGTSKAGPGAPAVAVDASVLDLIAEGGLGDARRAYTILERALVLAHARGLESLGEATVEEAAQRKLVLYDKSADAHYDVISAFIKSMRGSDPDAALYYLAVMLTGGEDPKFIARRMVIFASEDVGNADPHALEIAVAVSRAVEFVGMPECRINLAHGVTYLACAPKSNASYAGLESAMAEVGEHGGMAPPVFLRSTGYSGAKDLGHGVGYDYPHESGGYVGQKYLPKGLWGREFYHPSGEGRERDIAQFLERMRMLRREDEKDPAGGV